ncbi:dihydrofolate reductase family protein [Pedobacter sp.]|uniref:dihydrofolate reductase family protein n=1 Tax=Pedobacter sp. TaxID=1411316 RepID=UPI003D7F5DBD
MRKIIISAFMTLDGVIQAPGSPNEDQSGGFQHGGWVAPYTEEVSSQFMQKQMEPSDLLLGRKTFDIFASYWPANAAAWPGINEVTKYVISTTKKSSDWENSVFLNSVEDIEALKNTEGTNLIVWGSSELSQLLFMHDLVDELWLKIFPLILGHGKRLYNNGALPATFSLQEHVITPKGVIMANYIKAGELKTGTIT